jgi:hypothetical protein
MTLPHRVRVIRLAGVDVAEQPAIDRQLGSPPLTKDTDQIRMDGSSSSLANVFVSST